MYSTGASDEARTPSLKVTFTPEKQSIEEESSDFSPCPSSPFSRSSTQPCDGGWEESSPISRPLFARSEPGGSVLRAATVSPRMAQLANGIADMSPFESSSTENGPVPSFSLAIASPTPAPTFSRMSRLSPRDHGAASRIMHGANPLSFRNQWSVSSSDLSPSLTSPRPYSHNQSDMTGISLSSSYSSLEDYASTTTDSSDIGRFKDELSPPSSVQFAIDEIADTSNLPPRSASHTSPAIPLPIQYGVPIRSNSDGTKGRIRSRTMHTERLFGPEADLISSPTRARGGTPVVAGQRTTAFLSNPRSVPNRPRRESGTRSLPKPKLGGSVELPKDLPIAVGLIPNLKPMDVIPASPSRPEMKLPHLPTPRGESCKRITSTTLSQLVNGEFSHIISEFYVVDCRSEVEYAGGHVRGALHCPDPRFAIDLFITNRLHDLSSSNSAQSVAIIFHCEFSLIRAPAAWNAFRNEDRNQNKKAYPFLFYPDIYCLNGGYSSLFETNPELCDGGYVPEPGAGDRRSQNDLRRSHSISRIGISHSMGNLPSMDGEADDSAPNSSLAAPPCTPLRTRSSTPALFNQ